MSVLFENSEMPQKPLGSKEVNVTLYKIMVNDLPSCHTIDVSEDISITPCKKEVQQPLSCACVSSFPYAKILLNEMLALCSLKCIRGCVFSLLSQLCAYILNVTDTHYNIIVSQS